MSVHHVPAAAVFWVSVILPCKMQRPGRRDDQCTATAGRGVSKAENGTPVRSGLRLLGSPSPVEREWTSRLTDIGFPHDPCMVTGGAGSALAARRAVVSPAVRRRVPAGWTGRPVHGAGGASAALVAGKRAVPAPARDRSGQEGFGRGDGPLPS